MVNTDHSFRRFTKKNILAVAFGALAYLLTSFFLIGFKVEQVFLILLFCLAYFTSAISRKFILGFSAFIVFWIVFDYMKAFPNYTVSRVHIGDLYQLEKNVFGIKQGNILLTPNEYWRQNQQPFLDALAGFFYLCWVPVPLFFTGYLFFTRREESARFSLTFLWVNILGFFIYYIYPAAPPWYVQHFGTVFYANTPGSEAGLQGFDNLFQVKIFQSMYAKSSNVFAAMPSLHAAYPAIVLYYGIRNKLGKVNIAFAIIMAGIWFSAVYTSHHYIMDILAGVACAIIGIVSFNWLMQNVSWANQALKKFVAVLK